jgi:hypothetical protein
MKETLIFHPDSCIKTAALKYIHNQNGQHQAVLLCYLISPLTVMAKVTLLLFNMHFKASWFFKQLFIRKKFKKGNP